MRWSPLSYAFRPAADIANYNRTEQPSSTKSENGPTGIARKIGTDSPTCARKDLTSVFIIPLCPAR
jgi:hypothetical protein